MLTESPGDLAAVVAAAATAPGRSSPSPAGDREQAPPLHSSRDAGPGAGDAPETSEAPADELPSSQLDRVTEDPSEGPRAPEPSPREPCAGSKAGPAGRAPSPGKEKMGSLRRVDRGHYRSRRDRSSSGEQARDSRSRTEDQARRRRHSYTRERSPQGRSRPEHCSGGPHHACEHRGLARHRHRHSRSRGGSDQDWGRHPPESERSWGREKCYPDRTRWDRCRYYHDRHAPYTAREAWEWRPLHGDRDYDRRPHKDSYRGRRGHEPAARERERERHRLSSPRAGPPHARPPGPERGAPEGGRCRLAERFQDHESARPHKRRASPGHRGAWADSRAWRSLQRDPFEEPKAKKHKKSKKKKKSKDKHRERDSR